VLAVGLVVNARPVEIADAVSGIGLDVVQFHGDETPQECGLSPIAWWRAVRMRSANDLTQALGHYPQAEALLLMPFPMPMVGAATRSIGTGLGAIQSRQPKVPGLRGFFLAVCMGGMCARRLTRCARIGSTYPVEFRSRALRAGNQSRECRTLCPRCVLQIVRQIARYPWGRSKLL
jgi:hypothetical protein